MKPRQPEPTTQTAAAIKAAKKSRGMFISLYTKLLIGFTLLFSVVFAVSYYWFYQFSTEKAFDMISQDLEASLNGAVRFVDREAMLRLEAIAQDPDLLEATLNGSVVDMQPLADVMAISVWPQLSAVFQDSFSNALARHMATLSAESDAEDNVSDVSANSEGQEAEGQEAEGQETSLDISPEQAQASPYLSSNPDYLLLMNWLQQVNAIEPRAWPYIYVSSGGEREYIALADLWALYDPARAFTFLGRYTSSGPLYQGLEVFTVNAPRDRRTLSEEDRRNPLRWFLYNVGLLNRIGYEDRWGSWISAYQPIVNADGEHIGALGIDFAAQDVDDVQNAILDRVALAFGITYASLFVLVLLVSRIFTRPIVRLTSAAQSFGEGNYDQDLSLLRNKWFHDELVTLAVVLEGMADKIALRERKLKQEVVQLKIEIDEVKRQKQVEAIVDSESFQDLKKKAQAMRERKHVQRGDSKANNADEKSETTSDDQSSSYPNKGMSKVS